MKGAEIKNKKIYLLVVGIIFLSEVVFYEYVQWKIPQVKGLIEGQHFEREGTFAHSIIMGYLLAALTNGIFLTVAFLSERSRKIQITAAVFFFITIYIALFIGVITLIPCYIINLKKWYREREVRKIEINKIGRIAVAGGVFLLIFLCMSLLLGKIASGIKVKKVGEFVQNSNDTEVEKKNLAYYTSEADAIAGFWLEKEFMPIEFNENESKIIQMEDEKYAFSIWVGRDEKGELCLESFLLEKRGSMYSYPIWAQTQAVKGIVESRRSYDVKDEIVRDILISREASEITEKVNNENMFLWGAGTDEGLKDLTIIGQKPDRVMPVAYGDETVYFWYYMNGNEIKELLENEPKFEDMTMEEAAEYLEVRLGE